MDIPSQTALLVLQRLFAERGFRAFPAKREARQLGGMLACDVSLQGPDPDGPWSAEMILVLAEKEDSCFGATQFCHEKVQARCNAAFEQVINSLTPHHPVPKPAGGPMQDKLDYLAEVLRRGNATEQAPWSMAVLGVVMTRLDRDREDTLLVHLRFLHPQAKEICDDYNNVLDMLRRKVDFEATDARSRFTKLVSAHAGALSLEVARKDIKVSKAVLIIYGENQVRLAAYQTDLDTYRGVLQGRMDPNSLLLSWKPITGRELSALPLPPVQSLLPTK